MKKTLLLIASIAVLSCAKKKEDNPTPVQTTPTPTVQPTSFQITVLDEFGTSISNASVELFTLDTSSNPFGGADIIDKNIISSGKTNSDGIFSSLCDASRKVKWSINAGECMEQTSNGIVGKTTANKINTVTVTVKNTAGKLTVTNNTNDNYYIYKDGSLWFTIEANSFLTYRMSNNTYSIRVLQKDGYIIYPTDKTVSKTIDCGVAETVTIN